MTQIMKQKGILCAGTSMWCMMEIYTAQFCLVLSVSFISLDMRNLNNGYWLAGSTEGHYMMLSLVFVVL
jgi:hypothetical protein